MRDLDLLYQALDKFHTGMYWYTPKDSVDYAFALAEDEISSDLNVFEFHKIIAPLVSLSREDHTNIYLPNAARKRISEEIRFFPMTVVFLGTDLYCVRNGSDLQDVDLEGKMIESINGETPVEIVDKIGKLFASDGLIQTVKYNDLGGFSFSSYNFYYHGQLNEFEIKFKGMEQPVTVKSEKTDAIRERFQRRYPEENSDTPRDLLEFKLLNDSTAYLGVHTFSNAAIKRESKEKDLATFLNHSFRKIHENKVRTLIIDVSENGGGTEGNEGLLYSYFGDNYQKYLKVRVKAQRVTLDNGIDRPITLKTFGFWERAFANKKMKDNSLERRQWIGYGLMAFKKEPEYKFDGEVYVIISPATYSGASEFSNMMCTNDLATFVGQETGGGYLGNTSGYSEVLELPNSHIKIEIPALQFIMNVKPKLPFGRGVIPDYKVIPTFEQYISGENAALSYILEHLQRGR